MRHEGRVEPLHRVVPTRLGQLRIRVPRVPGDGVVEEAELLTVAVAIVLIDSHARCAFHRRFHMLSQRLACNQIFVQPTVAGRSGLVNRRSAPVPASISEVDQMLGSGPSVAAKEER